MRVALVAMGCVLAGLLVAAVASGQELSSSSDPIAVRGPGTSARADAEIVAARRAADDRAAWLKNPEARSERLASRTQFRGRLGLAAQSLAAEKFRRIVTGPLWEQPTLALGERKVGMNADNVMLIERDGEPAGVVDSIVPLQVTAPDGSKRPTDLSLTEQPTGFTPVSPVAPTRIGKALRDGVSLQAAGVNVTPSMPSDASGVLVDGRVFFADAATDTDVIVGATPAGAAIFYQLRSPESPGSVELGFSLPNGARLRAATDKRGGAEIVKGDQVVATIAPPIAFDAQSQTVPARYEIGTDRITVLIDHAGGDYAYPILLDPVIDQQVWGLGAPTSVLGWGYTTPWPTHFFPSTHGSWGYGLYSVLGGGRYYGQQTFGAWRYGALGTSYIYKLNWGLERQQLPWYDAVQPVCMTVGFVTHHVGWDWSTPWTAVPSASGSGPRVRCGSFNGGLGSGTIMCLISSCGDPGGHQPNYAEFNQFSYGAYNIQDWNVSYVGAAVVHLSDPEPPSVWGGPATTASDPSAEFDVFYSDPGLGLRTIKIDSPGNPDWNQTYGPDTLYCAGVNWWPCPNNAGRRLKYGNLPSGPQTIRVICRTPVARRRPNTSTSTSTTTGLGGSTAEETTLSTPPMKSTPCGTR